MIASLLGQHNPPGNPQAELWMGAHPGAPSMAVLDNAVLPLHELIAQDPISMLGESTVNAFGPHLPFLFKLLAAAKPLSIQAHPNLVQAREGWDRENAAGIPLGSAERNYKDPNHKPEILCALTPFRAMCGFRAPVDILRLFGELCAGEEKLARILGPVRETVHVSKTSGHDASQGLKIFLRALFSIPQAERSGFVSLAQKQAETLCNATGKEQAVWRMVVDFANAYPLDPAILAPLYLNTLELAPGEAVHLPAGVLHAYVEGFGIELMANSDNVLRGGLTSKHIDLDELERVLRFEAWAPHILLAEHDSVFSGWVYPTPDGEFTLRTIKSEDDKTDSGLPEDAPLIVLVTDGSFKIEAAESHSLILNKGESAFVSARSIHPVLRGQGKVWIASTGLGKEAHRI
jgi:mannose-6-phosphate isomerase